MAATPLPNPYDKMPLPRPRPSRSAMTIEGALAQASPRPTVNVGPAPTDPLTAALAGGKSADGKALSDTLAQSLIQQSARGQSSPLEAVSNLAMLWSGTRAEDRYLKDLEAKKNAPLDAIRAALVGKSPEEIRAALPNLLLNDPSTFAAGVEMLSKAPAEQWTDATFNGMPGQRSTSGKFDYAPAAAGDDAKPTLGEIQNPDGSGTIVKAWLYADGRPPVIAGDAPVTEPAPPAPPAIIRLIDERNQRAIANPSDPSIQIIDAAIAKETASTGLRIETTPDGMMTVTQGDAGPGQPVSEKYYGKGVGEYDAKAFGDMRTAGRAAIGTLSTLDRLDQLVDDQTFYSGFAGPAVKTGKQLLAALGVADADSVQSVEEFQGLTAKAALDRMGGSLGTGFSNADRDFVMAMGANMDSTPAGNHSLIEAHRRIAQREIEIAKMAREYARKHGGRLDFNFEDELSAWADANPLFADLAKTKSDAPAYPEGATATGPNGDKLRFTSGQWVPAQ